MIDMLLPAPRRALLLAPATSHSSSSTPGLFPAARRLVVSCSSSPPSPSSRPPSAGRHRYVQPPVYVSRADLTWGRPPWRFTQTPSVEELDLERHLPALASSGGGSGSGGAEQPPPQYVVVEFAVDEPTGLRGLWVRGTVAAPEGLRLRCEWCGEGFTQQLPAPATFEVWLNGEATSDAELTGIEELAFPESQDTCDLSPVVVDALTLALPSACLCGGRRCANLESRPGQLASTPAVGAPAASPFAALLRQQAGREGQAGAGAKAAGRGRRKGA